jgi:hypothetical protein
MGEGAERFADGGLGELGLTAGVAWQIGSWHIAYVHRPGGVLGDGNVLAIGWRPIP